MLHKTSPFWEPERVGFVNGADGVPIKDFLHIKTRNTDMRFFPDGEFPPLRGSW